MISFLKELAQSSLVCLAPPTCYGCKRSLPSYDLFTCPSCMKRLPYTNFHLIESNPFKDKFFGRIGVKAAASLFYYSKNNISHDLIHDLKYYGKRTLGVTMGQHFAHFLKESENFIGIDVIIPVPLHKKRLAYRGYNQSELIAQGLTKVLGIPINTESLIRTKKTKTQTKKSRIERFNNMNSAFKVQEPHKLQGKHILLVDDVMTSGATLEGCANELLKIPDVTISMITIGFAHFD